MVFGGSSKSKEAEEELPPEVEEGFSWSSQGQGLPAYTEEEGAGHYTLHVYKGAGALSNDLIVTGSKKDKVLYYLRMPTTAFHAWKEVTLFEGYKGGPVVCDSVFEHQGEVVQITICLKQEYTKPHFLARSNITIQYKGARVGSSALAPATTIELLSTQAVGDDHAFTVPGTDTKLKWKLPLLSWDMTLVNEASGEQVAYFDSNQFAARKAGKLTVDAKHLDLLELTVLTALAMNRHRRQKAVERRGWNGVHGGGGGGP